MSLQGFRRYSMYKFGEGMIVCLISVFYIKNRARYKCMLVQKESYLSFLRQRGRYSTRYIELMDYVPAKSHNLAAVWLEGNTNQLAC